MAMAEMIVFEMLGTGGLRKVAQFLEFSGLGRDVAHCRRQLN